MGRPLSSTRSDIYALFKELTKSRQLTCQPLASTAGSGHSMSVTTLSVTAAGSRGLIFFWGFKYQRYFVCTYSKFAGKTF